MSRSVVASSADEVTLEMPAAEMRRLGKGVLERLIDHYTTLRQRRVVNVLNRSETEALLREPPPEEGLGVDELLEAFSQTVAPHMSHVDHPRMFAFVPGAGSFVGAMGDALAAGYNIYAGTWIESSAAHQLELVVTDWFREWLGLPESAGGTLVSGGSVANLTGLILARESRLPDSRESGVIYTSELAHSCIDRSARILGFRQDQLRKLPTDERYRLRVDVLKRAVVEDRAAGRRPFCVVANGGATSNGAIDPLPEIADLCEAMGIWFHVDAAYGGFAVLDERGQRLLEGIERADSIALDAHKWLYTPFEAGCVLARRFSDLYNAFHVLPDYLVDVAADAGNVNMCDHGIQLSRSARALKIWMSIKHFGVRRYRAVISRTMDLARHAQKRLETTPGIEILAPAVLSVVAFRYVPPARIASGESRDETRVEQVNREILRRIWESGRAMLSSTRLRGRYALRLCIVNHNTRQVDVDEVIDLIGTLGPQVATELGQGD